MNQQKPSIQIQLLSDSPQSLNDQALDQLTRQLYNEINRLEAHQVHIKPQKETLSGAKMIEFAVAANVVIELIPHVVPPLMKLITDWVKTHQAQKDVAVNMQIGNKSVTITPTMTEDAIASEIQAATSLLQDSSDKEQRYALIIGTSQYEDEHLTKLQAPHADVTALAEVLENKKIGAFDQVTVLLNKTVLEVKQAVERFYRNRSRSDTLLLYFSGHGVKGDDGNLFLTARDTYRDVLRSTGISAEFIAASIDSSFSQRKILILDCCYSGAFAKGTKSGVIIGQSVNDTTAFKGNGFGQVVITASDAMQYAWEGDQVIGNTKHSLFTHYLVQGLKTGKADGNQDGLVSISDIYEYVFNQVTPHQTPSITSTDIQGQFIIAQNPFPSIQPAKLPDELLQSIQSPIVWQKEGAISELKRMLTSTDRSRVMAAKKQLEVLAEDDSRRVSEAASAALAAITPNTPPPIPRSSEPAAPPAQPPLAKQPQKIIEPPRPQASQQVTTPRRNGRYWGSLILTAILSFVFSFIIAPIGEGSVYIGALLLSPLAAWIIVKTAVKICADSRDTAFRNFIIGAIIGGAVITVLVFPISGIIYLLVTSGTVVYLFKRLAAKSLNAG